MLLDELMPEHDVTRVEHTIVDAPPGRVWAAALEADFMQAYRGSPATRALFGVRGAASALARRISGKPAPPEPEAMRLSDLPQRGEWVKLGEAPGAELAFGAIGVFWGREIRWRETEAPEFRDFSEPGYGKAGANFSIRSYGEGRSLLSYETRARGTDEAARRGIRRYWRLVSPGVGIVLRATLRYVKGIAEQP